MPFLERPGLSYAQQAALLDDDARHRLFVSAGTNLEELLYDWSFWGRPSQQAPDDFWIWMLASGRGGGKTRSACEWVRNKVRAMPGSRGALVARTSADVRDVIVYGESGIMSISPPSEMPIYEPSKRLITWPNGSTALMFSSEEPSQLRGPQFHWAYAEEMAAWKWIPDDSGLTAWDNLKIATRLGDLPQIVVATTPKKIAAIRAIWALAESDERVVVTRGRTADNAGNLSAVYLDNIYGMYEGTALARQELEGLLEDDVDGAMWNQAQIDELMRIPSLPASSELYRPVVVIGVDPSVAENPKDECGIVVGIGTTEPKFHERRVYWVEDASVHGPPTVWAPKVVEVARRWGAVVVAETNQGGALVKGAIESIDPGVRVVTVHAKVGKSLRAEPVVLASQQGRIKVVGELPDLEAQMTGWVPEVTPKSPDRVDAAVYSALAVLSPELAAKLGSGGDLRLTVNREKRSAMRATRRADQGARIPAYMARAAQAQGWRV